MDSDSHKMEALMEGVWPSGHIHFLPEQCKRLLHGGTVLFINYSSLFGTSQHIFLSTNFLRAISPAPYNLTLFKLSRHRCNECRFSARELHQWKIVKCLIILTHFETSLVGPPLSAFLLALLFLKLTLEWAIKHFLQHAISIYSQIYQLLPHSLN